VMWFETDVGKIAENTTFSSRKLVVLYW